MKVGISNYSGFVPELRSGLLLAIRMPPEFYSGNRIQDLLPYVCKPDKPETEGYKRHYERIKNIIETTIMRLAEYLSGIISFASLPAPVPAHNA